MSSDRVTVAVAVPMGEDLLAEIAVVDPRVEVRYDPTFFPGPRFIGDHHGAPLHTQDEAERDRFYEFLRGAEVLMGIPEQRPSGLQRVVDGNPSLRWVHGQQAGAGSFVVHAGLTPQQHEQVTVTSSVGVHAEPLADFSMLGILAATQDLPRLQRQQRERDWGKSRVPVTQLRGSVLLIVGLGEIGKALAKRAQAFGMRVIGTKRRVEQVDNVDEVFPADQLVQRLGEADHVVVTLPGTAATERLIDAEAIAAMKPGVNIVNVGRGAVIDESALIEGLRTSQVGYAALDVFETEPLASDSPLWEFPNVIISPHSAALDTGEERRCAEVFMDNLRRYLDGSPMRNVIDPEVGY